jgi:hypothetical protein
VTRLERLTLTTALFGLLLACCDSQAQAQEFHIEVGHADTTLFEFAQQSGLHLIYDASSFRNVHTHSIHGEFSWFVALGDLLQEVDWVAQEVGGDIRLTRLANPHPIAREWVDEADANGIVDCAPLRYTVTLLEWTQVRDDGRQICLVVDWQAWAETQIDRMRDVGQIREAL